MKAMTIGIMKYDVHLVGTSLRLFKGDRVKLSLASNQPIESGIDFFVRPLEDAGAEWGEDYSIGVSSADVSIDEVLA